jgi:hypothetical protein
MFCYATLRYDMLCYAYAVLGQGRAGQGRAGQGRAVQGRAGQSRGRSRGTRDPGNLRVHLTNTFAQNK